MEIPWQKLMSLEDGGEPFRGDTSFLLLWMPPGLQTPAVDSVRGQDRRMVEEGGAWSQQASHERGHSGADSVHWFAFWTDISTTKGVHNLLSAF